MSLQQSILARTLSENVLDELIGDEKRKIDQLNDKGYTALTLAASCGRDDYVKLLIEKGADVKEKCKNGENALCFTAEKAAENRTTIIGLLLKAGADVDETCLAFRNNTPLMLAIRQYPDDLKSIQLLVATIGTDNVSKTNNDEANVGTEEAISAEDFKSKMDEKIQDMGLDKFFSKNGNFLQSVAEKAVSLKNNPDTNLGNSENIQKLITFSMYQPVIFLDDSGSMDEDGRFEKQADLVRRVTRIASYLVPEDLGVAVYFINSDTPPNNKLREDGVVKLISRLVPDGATELGYNLKRKILTPMLYDVVKNNEELQRPLLITIITDGCPGGPMEEEGNFVNVLKECKTFLLQHDYPQTAIRFQISQIGSEDEVSEFFDSLKSDRQVRGMIYCTSDRLDDKYQEMQQNDKGLEEWLLTTLMEPIIQGRNLQQNQ
ncbi:hypothetical protein V8C35DRAFT_329153 [Trichoderma chlorosporum]